MDLKETIQECGETSRDKGFGESLSNVPGQLLLIATEVAEALEPVLPHDLELNEYRRRLLVLCAEIENSRKARAWQADWHQLHPPNILEELADICIRVFSFVEYNGHTEAFLKQLRQKMDYNKTREYRHGKQN